ncbi:hypothetical protein V5O48_018039, partial [Marasmius crinis-equi]
AFVGPMTANNHERYRRMGEFLRQFSTTNVYIDQSVCNPSSSNALPTGQSSLGPNRAGKTLQKNRAQPYNTSSSKQVAPSERNKFVGSSRLSYHRLCPLGRPHQKMSDVCLTPKHNPLLALTAAMPCQILIQ